MLPPLLLPLLLTTTALALPSPPPSTGRTPRHLAIHASSSAPSAALEANFHGLFGSKATAESIYIVDGSAAISGLTGGDWATAELAQSEDEKTRTLVWIGQAGIASPSPAFVGHDDLIANGLETIKERLPLVQKHAAARANIEGGKQKVFSAGGQLAGDELLRVVHSSSNSAIVQLHSSLLPMLDMLLPPGLVPVVIPTEALPLLGGVPQERVDFLAKLSVVPARARDSRTRPIS